MERCSRKRGKMAVERICLTLNKSVINKLKQKAARKGFMSIHEYMHDLLHHHAFHIGGRPRTSTLDSLADKFASHTKESRKRMRLIQRMGV